MIDLACVYIVNHWQGYICVALIVTIGIMLATLKWNK